MAATVRYLSQIKAEKRSRARRMALLNAIKNVPCLDCKESFPPYCMDFDHRDPDSKVNNVARLIANNYKMDDVLAEIAKCDIVCSNCHRKRTHGKKEA